MTSRSPNRRGRECARHHVVAALFLVAFNGAPALAGSDKAAEPDGYRMEAYRAPVPATLKGAKVVSTEETIDLWKKGETLFVDVLPHDPKPAKLPAGTVWKEKVRSDIPGSIWLANVGYGVLNKEMETYFRNGLEAHLGRNKDRKVLFYCMKDCWMSWNAAKRAVEWGYTAVFWYPLGTDGWIAAGQDTRVNKPL
ncbi:PQQ-dependent catabolism-associated CXXCW motif protein [Phyllobacterium sp. 0TCS1.6C]|uniref:PQQ-dependent catabolism-associated CXXCW motif protein n=1 Tax=unclassified Phyllobacterium TaxID=2638441 RepID=UPI00226503AD|nr:MULTISPECIES: PQQ-dependent catabolism-associated CXXCW motif protein [unclassified Phyllobacterium]MCX8280179.1 PQQ-dependent catabolism-associated CXXCW motif protein [Phyllobacterium sp. 0TCS1.6C]MCX8294260.1 PQQ-dependent catabolism-associated CXXCW motif protein [Phyllobacterium sp. 0TCS1.6A]